MSATCVPWYVLCSNTGLSKRGDPMNQNLAHVRSRGKGGTLPFSTHLSPETTTHNHSATPSLQRAQKSDPSFTFAFNDSLGVHSGKGGGGAIKDKQEKVSMPLRHFGRLASHGRAEISKPKNDSKKVYFCDFEHI